MSNSIQDSCYGSARAWERRSERSQEIHAECQNPERPGRGSFPIRPEPCEDKPLGRPEWRPKPVPVPIGPPIRIDPRPTPLPIGPPIRVMPPVEPTDPAPQPAPVVFAPKEACECYSPGRSRKVALAPDPIQPALEVFV